MARFPRVIIPDTPHHVLQRGARRQRTFFREADYRSYLDLLDGNCRHYAVEIWAYCMMPNHVHLILTPTQAEGLATAMKISQAAYTRRINAREDWTGTLWQGRFTSFPMDEAHLLMAARYIELNPVRAGLVDDPAKYPWSSTRERLGYGGDRMISPQPLSDLVPDWAKFLRQPLERGQLNDLRHCARTGRLAGSDAFIAQAEAKTGRRLALQRAARPANT